MQHPTTTRRQGFLIAAFIFLFTLTTVGQADAKATSLKKLLGNSGISFKIVRLDRTDGFLFGFTLTGKQIPSITIAPGFSRMLLVEVNGNEMIFQGDGTGNMQIIQADGDIGIALCVLDAVIDFLRALQICQSDAACLFSEIFTLVMNISTCSAGTTEPTQ